MNKVVYIQADMRFNPYMLHEMAGKSVIEHTLDKIHELGVENITGGIYDCDENVELVKLLQENKVDIKISKEENVTKRMLEVLKSLDVDYVIRVSGDMCLLDTKATQNMMQQVIQGNWDWFYYRGLSGCVADIIKKEVLLANEQEICCVARYMDAFEGNNTIRRYIPDMPLHDVCYPLKANSLGSVYWLEHVIKNKLDIYELSSRVIAGITAKDSEMIKTGLLADWGLPIDKRALYYDADGEVLPWLAMSAVEILKEKVTCEHLIFEYGAGNSTLFWAERAKHVISVEIDKEWCDRVKMLVGKNATIRYVDYDAEPQKFYNAILDEPTMFDVILIDGLYDRDKCAKAAIQRIKETGIIIVDNTDVEEYRGAALLLEKEGFRQLKLTGLMHGWIGHNCTTSLFYKQDNFMNL